jgi:hypothetical protein
MGICMFGCVSFPPLYLSFLRHKKEGKEEERDGWRMMAHILSVEVPIESARVFALCG